ncbi:MAG TPA: ATP-binding protein [Polyangia bacterium]
MGDVFRDYFDALPCYVSVQDRDHRIIAHNRRFADDFADEARPFCYQAYKRRDAPCPECPVDDTFRDGRPHDKEQLLTRRDGGLVSAIVHTAPITDANGAVTSVIQIFTDITEVKQLQQHYRTLFDEVPCYISVQDRALRLVDANRQFRTDFGDPREGHCYEVYKHRPEPCLVCPVAATFADGQIHTSEEVVTAKDGRNINILCYTAPIRDAVGETVAVMEMSTNITELRRLESQLSSLGLLVGSISHGIKGLLSGLDGGIYLLETGFKKDNLERIRNGWDMVQRNVDRIRSMVLNVLYYAKEREVRWERVDVREMIEDARQIVSSRAAQLDVELRADVDPAADAFEADGRAMRALLVNLLENSLDACRADRQKPGHLVHITARVEDGGLLLAVADNGIGMDQETRDKAFTLFFSSKGAEGTGLGLFIAQRIAKSHGGAITVQSVAGSGTWFTVRVPRTRPESAT